MFRTAFLVCLLAGLVLRTASGDVLWIQPQVNSFGGLSSQDARNPGGLGWFSEVADNFVAQAGWQINQVEFYGGYATPPGQEGHTEGFTIRFYTDNGGHPGTRLFAQDVFQFTETLYYTQPALGFGGYHYTLALNPSFNIAAGGTYWVSVVAILARGGTATEPQWGWVQASTTTPPRAHQWFFSPGNFTEQGNDVAYSLLGTSQAPCPGDVDGDRDVDLSDLTTLLAHFGISSGATHDQGDMDGDGDVDLSDLTQLLAHFGTTCP